MKLNLDDFLKKGEQEFLRNAYEKLIGRSPDSEGFEYYSGILELGAPRLRILVELRDSQEGKDRKHFARCDDIDRAVNIYRKLKRLPIGNLQWVIIGLAINNVSNDMFNFLKLGVRPYKKYPKKIAVDTEFGDASKVISQGDLKLILNKITEELSERKNVNYKDALNFMNKNSFIDYVRNNKLKDFEDFLIKTVDRKWIKHIYNIDVESMTWVSEFIKLFKSDLPYHAFINESIKEELLRSWKENESAVAYISHLNPLDENSNLYKKYRISISGLFISGWYLSKYKDLNSIDDPVLHYVLHGEAEGRFPNPYFSPKFYRSISDCPDHVSALLHYYEIGHLLDIPPSEYFSSAEFSRLMNLRKVSIRIEFQTRLSFFLNGGCEEIVGVKAYSTSDPDYKVEISDVYRDSIKHSHDLFSHNLRLVFDFFGCNEKILLGSDSKNSADNFSDELVWIIPDFAKGGGGHTTIFRMVKHLSLRGFRQRILISSRASSRTGIEAKEAIYKDFFVFDANVSYYDECDSKFFNTRFSAAIATSFETVPFVSNVNSIRKYYFVQDFEPFFHAAGSLSLIAESTYKENLICICASDWLKSKLEAYGRKAISFRLAVDKSIYNHFSEHHVKQNSIPRIVLYGRSFTSRRCVELAVAGLIRAYENGVVFHCDIIHGDSLPVDLHFPFPNIRYATLSPQELANLYNHATLGIVFSATNYSLLPQEMLACGLEVLEIASESSLAIYPSDVVNLVKPDLNDIVENITSLLKFKRNPLLRSSVKEWLGYDWNDAADSIASAINPDWKASIVSKATSSEHLKCSVVVPIFNGMDFLPELISRLDSQITPWGFEVIFIDSSSTDGSDLYIESLNRFRLYKIKKNDFGHGKTRNYGASLARGEYIAFLTQDALPLGSYWIYDLVTSLQAFPNAVAAFSRHIAHPGSTQFAKRDLNNFFNIFYNGPQRISKSTNWSSYNLNYNSASEFARFYSDNSSCMSRFDHFSSSPNRDSNFFRTRNSNMASP